MHNGGNVVWRQSAKVGSRLGSMYRLDAKALSGSSAAVRFFFAEKVRTLCDARTEYLVRSPRVREGYAQLDSRVCVVASFVHLEAADVPKDDVESLLSPRLLDGHQSGTGVGSEAHVFENDATVLALAVSHYHGHVSHLVDVELDSSDAFNRSAAPSQVDEVASVRMDVPRAAAVHHECQPCQPLRCFAFGLAPRHCGEGDS